MSLRWTCALFCVVLASATSVWAQTAAAPAPVAVSVAPTQSQPAAVVIPPAAPTLAAGAVPPVPPIPSIPTDAAPHVQAVAVAKTYSDDWDEDEDSDEDLLFRPSPTAPAQSSRPQPVPARRIVSIDERIAAQKYKIEQLKGLLAKQREKHAATAQLIAQRNKEIQERMKRHAAEMAKAANIQRRRDALARAERAEKARKAAAKRAAEIRAKQQVFALQKQLAQQHEAAAVAQRALLRQQQEDAVRQRIMASQHQTYEQLEAELQAHEREWANRKGLQKLKTKIKIPKKPVGQKLQSTRRLARRVTQTPRLPANPFLSTTPNPSWFPRRRLLTPRIRRWLIIRIIRNRRATPPPVKFPSITIARRQYLQARARARTTLRNILQKRTCKRRDARQAFRKLSRQLAITATLARQALIRAQSRSRSLSTKLSPIVRRRSIIRRPIFRRRPIIRRPIFRRRPIIRRPIFRRRPIIRRPIFRRRPIIRRPIIRRRTQPKFEFQLSDNPYPKLVSTRDATSSAPRSTKLAEIKQEITNNAEEKYYKKKSIIF